MINFQVTGVGTDLCLICQVVATEMDLDVDDMRVFHPNLLLASLRPTISVTGARTGLLRGSTQSLMFLPCGGKVQVSPLPVTKANQVLQMQRTSGQLEQSSSLRARARKALREVALALDGDVEIWARLHLLLTKELGGDQIRAAHPVSRMISKLTCANDGLAKQPLRSLPHLRWDVVNLNFSLVPPTLPPSRPLFLHRRLLLTNRLQNPTPSALLSKFSPG